MSEYRLYGKALKILRIKKGVQSKDLAKLLGVDRSLISHAETSRIKLTVKHSKLLLEYFEVSEEDIRTLEKAINK